jgi:ADP-heptose:LPS heptosyltransferase
MALAPATAYCLIRSEGMGDMLLALGAAKALKRLRGALIFLGTNKQHVSLARACPHVDEVFTNNDEFQTIIARYPDVHVTVAQFDRASFGIAPRHQTDAYLDELGVSAPPEEKNIELRTDAAAAAQVAQWLETQPPLAPGRARVLLHASAGDPNRTWPQDHWQALAARLIKDGHQVIAISHRSKVANRGVQSLEAAGLLRSDESWDGLGRLALMRQSHLLISPDSGPIQLAAATDIGIVGIYSVIAGANRLPYRRGTAAWRAVAVEPECRQAPCYEKINDPLVVERYKREVMGGNNDTPRLFAEFCLARERYRCMREDNSVERVYTASVNLLAESARD